MENYQLNLIMWTVECLNNRVGHSLDWEWILAVDEMVNTGDSSMLEQIFEEEREYCAEGDIISFNDPKQRITDICERLGQYPFETMEDALGPDIDCMVCEICELAFTDDEWKRQTILGREVKVY